jgi:hypothetical protein
MTTTWFKVRQLPALLRGDTIAIHPWVERVTISQTVIFLVSGERHCKPFMPRSNFLS